MWRLCLRHAPLGNPLAPCGGNLSQCCVAHTPVADTDSVKPTAHTGSYLACAMIAKVQGCSYDWACYYAVEPLAFNVCNTSLCIVSSTNKSFCPVQCVIIHAKDAYLACSPPPTLFSPSYNLLQPHHPPPPHPIKLRPVGPSAPNVGPCPSCVL